MCELKREFLKKLNEGLSLEEISHAVGVSIARARRWYSDDREFKRVVNADLVARVIRRVLRADDLSRSELKLTEDEREEIRYARHLVDTLPDLSPELFGFLKEQ